MSQPSPAPRLSPLQDVHVRLGAKFAPFGGWSMPLEYADTGVVAEHTAVRTDVGVFDVSHLGTTRVRGPGAVAFLNSCLTGDLDRIGAGRAQYTLCCADDGGVVDDLIVYRFADDHVLCVPNAANAAEVTRRVARAAPAGVEVRDEHGAHAILAVQGPRSAEVVTALGLPTEQPYMGFAAARWSDVDVVVCRTGYTGEHGYELIVPAAQGPALWTALLATGHRVTPCGLGARDTLRTEMGYPLHGHELTHDITPVQAGVGWAVGWGKPSFWGRDALLSERDGGPGRLAVGLLARGPGIPRSGMRILADGVKVGALTSGTFSPTLRVGIALGLVTAEVARRGGVVEVDVRGRRLAMEITAPPFVTPSVRA